MVGRAGDAGLRLEDEGVFDRHFNISFKRNEGFLIFSQANAVTAVNHQPVSEARLRAGDVIQAGSASIAFALSPMRQRSLRFRESLVWFMLGVLCLAQVAVIYALLER
jgi:predicted component of type VI protein secretion system